MYAAFTVGRASAERSHLVPYTGGGMHALRFDSLHPDDTERVTMRGPLTTDSDLGSTVEVEKAQESRRDIQEWP